MTRLALLLSCLVVAPLPLVAQSGGPLVEVASVRVNKSGGTAGAFVRGGPERFGRINSTLQGLIYAAYPNIEQILDGPDWANTIRFDVVGIGDPTQSEQLRLQEVIRDRFALKVRRESRQFDVYALVLARRDRRLGPDLRKSDCTDEALKKYRRMRPGEPACGTIQLNAGEIIAKGFSLRTLGGYLRSGRRVFDRTGLKGDFDIRLEWAPSPADDGPSLFTAVQDQLGLKLESTKAPLDVIVIERAERPTEN